MLNLSSTRAMAGLDMVAAIAAAIKEAPIPIFDSEEDFSSIEHLTFPLLPIAGRARFQFQIQIQIQNQNQI